MSKATNNEAFIRDYQARRGLKVDGWAGPEARADLNKLLPPAAVRSRSLKYPSAFFAIVRDHFKSLTGDQVVGVETLLKAMKDWPVSWVAYGLATAWHETAATMHPIKEYGGEAYFQRMYDIQGQRPAKARELGNVSPGDGAKYAGRGYPQVTGRNNYERAEKVFGIPFASNPDLMLVSENAAKVMVYFMENGLFTGKSLKDYLPGDYVSARRIINGQDRAKTIADYAQLFEAALDAGDWTSA